MIIPYQHIHYVRGWASFCLIINRVNVGYSLDKYVYIECRTFRTRIFRPRIFLTGFFSRVDVSDNFFLALNLLNFFVSECSSM